MRAVFYNANVVALDSGQPRAEAVAVEDGRIAAIGNRAEMTVLHDAHTDLIDCRGGFLLPGFVDAHIHLLSYAASFLSISCAPPAARSIADIQRLLRQQATRTPEGRWLRATGYDETALAEKRHPNRRDLDAAVPDRPVRLIHRSGHASVLNSMALSLAGITSETEEPPGGYMERELPSGEPSGLLMEMDALIDRATPLLDYADLAGAVRQASASLLAQGVTAVQDATATNGAREWETFQRLLAESDLRLSVTLMEGVESLDRGGMPETALDGRLRRGPVKIAVSELGDEIAPDEDELASLVWEAHRRGRQVAIHAVEERAIGAAVAAIEGALKRRPRADHRHRIEHCSVCPPALAERIDRAGICVVTQPAFLYFSGDRYLSEVAREKQSHLYPLRRLESCGVALAAGSDAPVVPPRPLLGVQSAVVRRSERGAVLSPEESLDLRQALRMHTLSAAWAAFQEGERGSIAPGKRADMILLSNDPAAVPADEVADLEVEMTVVGGKIVWPEKQG